MEATDYFEKEHEPTMPTIPSNGHESGQPIAADKIQVIAIDGPKVALTIHQRITHGEVLGHASHGIVHGCIAVGMVFTQHLTDDTGAFAVGGVGP